MTAFHDVRFPTGISLRASGGPERLTRIVALASGHEQRNTAWDGSRRRFDAGYGVRSLDDLHAVIAFFEARRGRLHGFRWKDWSDYRSGKPLRPATPLDQEIGTGDGTMATFQLAKTYADAGGSHTRAIAKPVPGSIVVAVEGAPAAFTADTGSGTVTLAEPPASGAPVTAGFEFDVPVRFDTDRLDINLAGFEAGEIPSIPLIEIR